MLVSPQMYIGGRAHEAEGTFESLDPYTGEAWAIVPEASEDDVRAATRAARTAFTTGEWSGLNGRSRGVLLRRLGAEIERAADELALAETRDNGKLLREMIGQVRALPAWYDYYAGLADKVDGRVVATGREDFFGFVLREPVGVVAAILPWNSPLLLLTFKLAPALAAGCTVVAKPSEHAPVSSLLFAELVERAGFPPGAFNVVTGRSRDVGRWLVADPHVDHVSFTGADATGAAVASSAAAHWATSTLELGGKSANIVFPDADLEAASNGIVAGIFAASGQTCIAGSRALLHEEVYDAVLDRVVGRARTIRLGDPKEPETEMGPLSFQGQYDKVASAVDAARGEGATVVHGGGNGGHGGLFYEPTVVTDVSSHAPVCQDEIFGPVLAVLPFRTDAEAVATANASRYGLAAGVWTRDLQRTFRLIPRLDVGTVWVNAYRTLNQTMPFGGRKASGFGRENGTEGLSEYLTEKAVWIETGGHTRDPFVLG